jgi:hypothetical protein
MEEEEVRDTHVEGKRDLNDVRESPRPGRHHKAGSEDDEGSDDDSDDVIRILNDKNGNIKISVKDLRPISRFKRRTYPAGGDGSPTSRMGDLLDHDEGRHKERGET